MYVENKEVNLKTSTLLFTQNVWAALSGVNRKFEFYALKRIVIKEEIKR
jgi:hypothetical protein